MKCEKCNGTILRDWAGDESCLQCGWSDPGALPEFFGLELRRGIRTPRSRKQDAARAQAKLLDGERE